MDILIFAEFVSSNNFFMLLLSTLNLIDQNAGLGVYLQGIPIANAVNFFWGTNSGIRTIPLLLLLSLLQMVFDHHWDIAYMVIALTLPFILFLLANRILGKITVTTIVGALLFSCNLWIINRLFTGFWQLNIVYSFLPFLVAVPIRIATKGTKHWKPLLFWSSLYALCASIVLTSQPHFLIMIALFGILHIASILLKKDISMVFQILKFYVLSGIVFVFINFYFLIPGLFFSELHFTAPSQYFSIGSVIFNGQGNLLHHVLRFEPLGYSNIDVNWGFIHTLQLVPFLATVIFFFRSKNKNYVFFTLLILFIFFSKGLNAPGENISHWIYENVFFMHYFRDPSRFLAGAALFSAFIIATSKVSFSTSKHLNALFVVLILIFFIVINKHSVFDSKIQMLKRESIPKSYIHMQDYINASSLDRTHLRLLLLPHMHGLGGYPWYNNPSPNTANTIFDATLPLKVSLANSSNYPDTFSNQMSAYIYSKFNESYDSNVLRTLSVGDILTDSSVDSPENESAIATKSAALRKSDQFTHVHSESNLSLFKVASSSGLVSIEQPIFAIGNLDTILKLSLRTSRPVVLLNQQIENSRQRDQLLKHEDLYIDFDDPVLSLVGERLAKEYSVDILSSGWNYDQIFGNNEPYKMKYIKQNGELFTSGRSVINNPSISKPMKVHHKISKGKYTLLIKSLTQEPTEVTIRTGNNSKIIKIDTQESLDWNNFGEIEVDQDINEIYIDKPTNPHIIIDHLILVPISQYFKTTEQIESLIGSMNLYTPSRQSEFQENTQYSVTSDSIAVRIPTKYLTYNLSYGKHWESNAQAEKFISNGYGMTFISSDKDISELRYAPNSHYKLSLLVSAAVSLIVLIYFFLGVIKKWY